MLTATGVLFTINSHRLKPLVRSLPL